MPPWARAGCPLCAPLGALLATAVGVPPLGIKAALRRGSCCGRAEHGGTGGTGRMAAGQARTRTGATGRRPGDGD